ncbi:MAG: PIN domain-containing protein [Myxococcales bacterium]|nr:PIN domain-containing protein [Myxococcales bacterium]
MIAVDTNILVHAHRRDAAFHRRATVVVRELAESPAPWAICFHNLIEFYGVATHARLWSQPSSPHQALEQIAAWRESMSLRILGDEATALTGLSELLVRAHIQGAKVHDARIANCCLAHGVRLLLSADRDFSSFPALKTKNPLVDAK